MTEPVFTPASIAAIAAEIRARDYQRSVEAKAALFARIYPEPENRILVSDDPAMPIVAASMLIGDDEGFELMAICAEHIPRTARPIEFFVLAGLVQFEGEDPMPFAHLVKDDQVAGCTSMGQQMKTTVTVTLDGVEDTADELAENPFYPD